MRFWSNNKILRPKLSPTVKACRVREIFRPTPAEYQAVLDWLKSEGFQVTSGSTTKMYIWCYGTTDQVQKAFQIEIVMLSSGAFWNLDDPAIPQEFSGVIDSIVGLDNLYALKQRFKSSRDQIRSTGS